MLAYQNLLLVHCKFFRAYELHNHVLKQPEKKKSLENRGFVLGLAATRLVMTEAGESVCENHYIYSLMQTLQFNTHRRFVFPAEIQTYNFLKWVV